MFGFNRTQAQVILDNQQELIASVNALALIVGNLVKDNPINRSKVDPVLADIQRIMTKRQNILEGVFS